MYIIKKTSIFDKWLRKLKSVQAKVKILARLKNIELGNLGNYKILDGGISEIKINYWPGYRLYYKKTGNNIILLLIGGDKSTQVSDIAKAKKLTIEYGE